MLYWKFGESFKSVMRHYVCEFDHFPYKHLSRLGSVGVEAYSALNIRVIVWVDCSEQERTNVF